ERIGSGLARDLIENGVKSQTTLVKNLGGHGTLFAKQAEQEMFGSDVSMLEAVAFLVCESENVLRFRRQRQLDRGRNLLTKERATLDFLANRLDGNLCAREETAG